MYIKVNNLIQTNGIANYKTLDINKIETGSAIYDFINNVAYVEYSESYTPHNDLIEVTQTDYDNVKTTLTNQQGLTLEERVTAAEQTLNAILLGGI